MFRTCVGLTASSGLLGAEVSAPAAVMTNADLLPQQEAALLLEKMRRDFRNHGGSTNSRNPLHFDGIEGRGNFLTHSKVK